MIIEVRLQIILLIVFPPVQGWSTAKERIEESRSYRHLSRSHSCPGPWLAMGKSGRSVENMFPVDCSNWFCQIYYN